MARRYDISILNITTFDGEGYSEAEALDHLDEADQVFYSISYGGQEEFYRWVAGPFESLEDIEAAIEDEQTFYEEMAA